MSKLLTIYTDGSCLKDQDWAGGWAFVVVDYREEIVHADFGGEKNTTNNRMELKAILKALQWAKDHEFLRIFTDSKYSKNACEFWMRGWKSRDWKKACGGPVKNMDLLKTIDTLMIGKHIDWQWVPGHSGHPFNERADELAGREAWKIVAKSQN